MVWSHKQLGSLGSEVLEPLLRFFHAESLLPLPLGTTHQPLRVPLEAYSLSHLVPLNPPLVSVLLFAELPPALASPMSCFLTSRLDWGAHRKVGFFVCLFVFWLWSNSYMVNHSLSFCRRQLPTYRSLLAVAFIPIPLVRHLNFHHQNYLFYFLPSFYSLFFLFLSLPSSCHYTRRKELE